MITLHLTLASLLIVAPATAAPAGQSRSSPPALDRLYLIAANVCGSPPQYGFSRGADGSISGELSVPKLIAKLLNVSISAHAKGNLADWKGPLQRDIGPLLFRQSECGERVFEKLLDRFYLVDRTTNRPIAKPPAPRRSFEQAAARVAAGGNSLEHSSGNIVVTSGQTGGVSANNIGILNYVEHKDRARFIVPLRDLYTEGSAILHRVETTDPTDANVASEEVDANAWLKRSYEWINLNMTETAAKKFWTIDAPAKSYIPNGETTRSATETYANLRDELPSYLENVKYLMDNDTMDPDPGAKSR
jgi:hypothetical protein